MKQVVLGTTVEARANQPAQHPYIYTDQCEFINMYVTLQRVITILRGLGAVSIRKTVLPGMAIPMLKIRRPNGRLIFNMEITIRR